MSYEAGADIAGGCCLFITASLQTYCNTKAFGAGGCCGGNRTAGCCGSCCDDSFNEDSFENQAAKSGATLSTSQPVPSEDMVVSGSSGGDKKPT